MNKCKKQTNKVKQQRNTTLGLLVSLASQILVTHNSVLETSGNIVAKALQKILQWSLVVTKKLWDKVVSFNSKCSVPFVPDYNSS